MDFLSFDKVTAVILIILVCVGGFLGIAFCIECWMDIDDEDDGLLPRIKRCCSQSYDDEGITALNHLNETPLMQPDSGQFHSLSLNGESSRPIGFTVTGSNLPYPLENRMPQPAELVRPTAPPQEIPDSSSATDANPPSYDQVMSNKTLYDHPTKD
ncbi:uncharacterized protein LOC132258454 [Phlebotomus argentipes]|uniref:uncharacterized protein LOC132258454 n=1 Tax=Phlebotomus argentipes TaxID=94469 RepID=UPI0028930EA7|nr:uncharacterized protein LOC132258454 [Phlebotomus argentipes]